MLFEELAAVGDRVGDQGVEILVPEVRQVEERGNNQVDRIILLVRVRQFLLVEDEGLTAEFIGKLFKLLESGDAVDRLGRLEVEPQTEVRLLRLDSLDQLMNLLEDLVLVYWRQLDHGAFFISGFLLLFCRGSLVAFSIPDDDLVGEPEQGKAEWRNRVPHPFHPTLHKDPLEFHQYLIIKV